MAYQDNWNAYAAYKAQTGLGAIASGSGATILPLTGGKGALNINAVNSGVVRRDAMQQRGRQTARKTSGSYPGELSLINQQAILAAIMQGTAASGVSITNSTPGMSSATLSATGSTITFSAGSLITVGIRVGDVVTFTSALAAADLNQPLLITGLTATTMTVNRSLTTVTGPVSTYAFSVKGKKLINPAAGSLVKTYFTVEEAELGLDASKVFSDCLWSKMDIAMQANGMITASPSWVGTGAMQALTGASTPYFTSPTDPTAGLSLAAIDASVLIGSTQIADLTSFSLTLDNGATAPDVAGAKISPDVALGAFKVSGSLSMLKKDYTYLQNALNEDQLSIALLAAVPGSSPVDFVSIYLPNLSIPAPDDSEISASAGFRTQTINIQQELVGIDTRGGAYDPTMIKFQFSQ